MDSFESLRSCLDGQKLIYRVGTTRDKSLNYFSLDVEAKRRKKWTLLLATAKELKAIYFFCPLEFGRNVEKVKQLLSELKIPNQVGNAEVSPDNNEIWYVYNLPLSDNGEVSCSQFSNVFSAFVASLEYLDEQVAAVLTGKQR